MKLFPICKRIWPFFWSTTDFIAQFASIKKIDEDIFKDCPALKVINVPAKKTEYYKKRLPEELHHLIVELPPVKKAKKWKLKALNV